MRPLDNTAKALLNACAKAIVNNTPTDINLFGLNEYFSDDNIRNYLAQEVEALSFGKRTIRKADLALFERRVMGLYAYLVACAGDTPHETVTELSDDMVLVGLGPYRYGLEFPIKPATPAQVAAYRASAAESQRRHLERQQAEQAAADFIAGLAEKARQIASRSYDSKLRGEAEVALQDPSKLSLADIAAVSLKLGMTLPQLYAWKS